MSVAYRLRQVWHSLTAGPLPNEAWEEITAVLTPAEVELFQRFANSDQWHGLRVMRTLQASGHHHPHLKAAALLHDIGKSCVHKLTIWERSLVVIMQKCCPQKVAEWGQSEPVGWKRPFVVRQQHAAWGADMANQAGSSTFVTALIRRHQDHLTEMNSEEDQLLAQLQWADDQN